MNHDFKYITKKSCRLKIVFADAVCLIREIQNEVRDSFTFQYRPVGSYSRNMVTCDEKSNIGFDLDFDFIVHDENERYTAKEIKKTLQKAMHQIALHHGYDFPEDSTRVLTMKCKDRKNNKILHSIDFAIKKEHVDKNECVRRKYIHYDKKSNQYLWREQPYKEYNLPDRIALLKREGLWDELRKYYLEKKNENDNPTLHSRQLFSMAVNELLQKHGLEAELEPRDPSRQHNFEACCEAQHLGIWSPIWSLR